MRRWRPVLAAIGVGFLALASQTLPVRGGDESPRPLDGLSELELARFTAGAEQFQHRYTPSEGLGPVFNGRSCAECHTEPGPGGSHDSDDRQVVLFGRSDFAGSFDPLISLGGPVRSQRSTEDEVSGCDLSEEVVPDEANVKSHRQPASLYGLGLIEAIPEATIRDQIKAGAAADPGEVQGRVNESNGKVGRFGWKAQAATLEEFVSQEMHENLGLTNPVRPRETSPQGGPMPPRCDPGPDPEDDGSELRQLVDFVLLLSPYPRVLEESNDIRRGQKFFEEVGCVACHTPSLRTGKHAIEALSERDAQLYSDLLIHDLGEHLVDYMTQGAAGSTDWRTTPLWGLSQKERYLHDGRTEDLREVIELHSGEARASRNRFRKLPEEDQDDLLEFLRSL